MYFQFYVISTEFNCYSNDYISNYIIPINQNILKNPTYWRKRISRPMRIVAPIPKLDGVGPVDNRPSTDKLHQIV